MIPKNIRIIEIEYDVESPGVVMPLTRKVQDLQVIGLHGFQWISGASMPEEIWKKVEDVDIRKLIPRGFHLKSGSGPILIGDLIIDDRTIFGGNGILMSDESKHGQSYENEPYAVDWPKISESISLDIQAVGTGRTKGSILIYAEDPSILRPSVIPIREFNK